MQKLIKIALIAPIASLLILAISTVPVSAARIRTFIAVLNGGQEVPATNSNALGVAFMTFDKETRDLCFSISFTDLVATETAAHFHAPAAAGVNAAVRFGLFNPGAIGPGSPKNGCVGPLDREEERDLKKGLFYINIHSQTFGGGEIRGQVLPIKGAK